jgi:hypothetical protein
LIEGGRPSSAGETPKAAENLYGNAPLCKWFRPGLKGEDEENPEDVL